MRAVGVRGERVARCGVRLDGGARPGRFECDANGMQRDSCATAPPLDCTASAIRLDGAAGQTRFAGDRGGGVRLVSGARLVHGSFASRVASRVSSTGTSDPPSMHTGRGPPSQHNGRGVRAVRAQYGGVEPPGARHAPFVATQKQPPERQK